MTLRKKAIHVFTIIALIGASPALRAETTHDQRMSDHLTLQDITGFSQDSHGNMWIATLGGLNRYNGSEYEHFTADAADSTSLMDDFVFSIYYDKEKELLYAGTRMGLCRYNESDNTFTAIGPRGSHAVYNIYKDRMGALWLSTHFNPVVIRNEEYAILKNIGSVNLMWEDEAGKIWAGTGEKDALALRKDSDIWEKFHVPGGRHIISRYESADRKWWLGTDDGVTIFDPASRTFSDGKEIEALDKALGHTAVNFIIECEPYRLLLGTTTKGILCYDIVSGNITHNNPSRYNQTGSSEIQCCSRDDRGNIWIGTYDKGFYVANKQTDYFCQDQDLNKVIRNKFVTRIVPGIDGDMWISTRYDGIIRLGRDGALTEFDSKSLLGGDGGFLESIMVDSRGRLWAAFESSLVIARPEGSRLVIEKTLREQNVRVLKEDAEGNIWAGSWWGLKKFVGGGMTPVTVLDNDGVPEIIALKDGRMLFSKYGIGLGTVGTDGEIRELEVPGELERHSMNAITLFEDTDGNIWIGTYDNGLGCLRKDGTAFALKKEDGLPSNNVLSVIEDLKGDIWASTHSGVVHLVENGDRYSVLNYNLREMFPGEQYHEKSGGISPDGTIFFGGNHGITYFSPAEIPQSQYPPRINLEDLKIFNQSIVPGDGSGVLGDCITRTSSISLSHNQRTIAIDYAGIDFFSSNNLAYKYMLEGFDREVNNVGTHRRAIYSNLAPGKYVFKVWSVNNMGVECDKPASLEIKVRRAPWFSMAAIIAYLVLICSLVWFLLDMWVKLGLNRKRAELEHNEKERELEVSRMKTLFFSNISHELRTPLSLISAPAEQLLASSGIKGEDRHLVEIINRSSSRMTQLMSQLMDFAKMENGVLKLKVSRIDIMELLAEQCDAFSGWCAKKSVKLSFSPHKGSLYMLADTDKMEKIMNNLLSNAVKHTPEGGTIEVVTREIDGASASEAYGNPVEGRFLEVSVLDSGDGMSEENLKQLFIRYPKLEGKLASYNGNGIGLNYTKNIVERHKGRITACLREEGGMRFSFIIPLEDVYIDDEKASTSEMALVESVIAPSDYAPEEKEVSPDSPTILVAEDNPDLREFLEGFIGKQYNVVAFENGRLAWDQIQKKNPDLIVSDVIMPEISGNELCSRIKDDQRLCHIPVILLTAKSSAEDRIEGLENGADVYIGKPFRTDELMLSIRNLLHTKQVIRDFFLNAGAENTIDSLSLNPKDRKFLDTLTALMEKELSNPDLSVDDLTVAIGLSRTALFVKIKGLTGMSPNEFIRSYRFKVAARMIENGEAGLADISDACGFASYSYFSKAFKKHFGVNPKDYRKKN